MNAKKVFPLLLAAALQFMPMVRVALPVMQSHASAPAWAIVMRVAAGAVALLGSYHAVSAATAIVAPYTVNATNGVRYIRQLGTSVRTAYSWTANTAPTHTSVYPLTPGLYLTNLTGKIGGTPTWAGTSNITISAWENADNSGGQVSSVFTFTIAPGSGPPVISASSGTLSVLRGGTAALTAGASGTDPLSYRWQFLGLDIPNATNSILTLSNVQATNTGVYTVFVTNAFGSAVTNVSLIVLLPPTITDAPPSQAVAPGSTVSLTVGASGTSPLLYRWQYNGANILGGTNATLTLPNAQSTNSGTYNVLISNPYGTVSNSLTLTVTGSPGIISQPQDKAIGQGGSATFSVVAGGATPLSYQWFRDGALLAGKTSATLSIAGVKASDAGRYSVIVSNALGFITSTQAFLRLSPSSVNTSIPLFPLSKMWQFNTNGLDLGTAWRDIDYDDSNWASGPGIIAKEDSGNPTVYALIRTPISITSGGLFLTNIYFRTHFSITNKAFVTSLTFSNVIDDGCVFYLNGTEIFRYNMPSGIITASTLASANLSEGVFTIQSVSPALLIQGDNVLAAEVHQVNNTSSDIVMGSALFNTISIPNTVPLILNNPTGQSAPAGNTVALSASADGTAPLTYQWYKGTSPVPGGNGATLYIVGAQGGDSGDYTLVAMNSFGSATSQVATVSIATPNTAPTLDFLADQLVLSGSVLTLTAHASDADIPAQSLSFSLDPDAPAGASIDPVTGVLTWSSAGTPLLGTVTFTVRVTDNGSPALSQTRTFHATVTGNHPPSLESIPNLVADVLLPLRYTNSAADADQGIDKLTFSLAPGAPAGARVHPTKGIFSWRPSRAQAASTNLISVVVTDDGAPARSDSKPFQVVVGDYAEISLGRAVLLVGDSTNLPITLGSSALLSNVSFTVDYPGLLTGWSVQPSAGLNVQANVDTQTPNHLLVTLSGNPLPTGTQPLATLSFTVAPQQGSAFLYLTNDNLSATRMDGTIVTRTLVSNGRVVAIAQVPLVEALMDSDQTPSLVLYGHIGATHFIEASADFGSNASWNTKLQHTLTNLSNTIPFTKDPNPAIFYRLR
ncbi:MAG: hypothetical protein JWM16_1660 [Verrucomicrobiales bacterium]|nr:hypothetical protein [Verrucomicrobiales bacterium]